MIRCTCCDEPARKQCLDHDTGYGVCDRCFAKHGRENFCHVPTCTAHGLNYFKVTFADGNTIETGMNATLEEAKRYYLGTAFNFGDTDAHPKDNLVKAIRVEKL